MARQIETDVYIELRESWIRTGRAIDAVREILGIPTCKVCKAVVPNGKRHVPFNGNQMFACEEIDA